MASFFIFACAALLLNRGMPTPTAGVALIRQHSLDRLKLEFASLDHGDWAGAPPGFIEASGGFSPMGPCG